MALLSALLLAALCPGQPAQEPAAEAAPPAIQVAVDPRVELLSIVFRLAGNPEYQRQEFRRYAAAIERHFGGFRDHPAVVEARRLRATRGVSYDAVMSLAVHLDGVPLLRPRLRFEDSLLESRWRPEEARAFLGLLRSFVEDTGFEAFLAGKAELYALAEWRMRRLIEEEVELDWFEGFFGAAPEASFHVLIGLGNGPSNYGPKFRGADGAEQLYAVLGTWLLDEEGDPLFDESLVGTLVHEFNHSFVNHHVYAHEAELRAAGERLYPLVEQAMRRQAYGSWQTMMHESLVRAAVVRYQRETRGEVAEAMEIALQEQRGFLWTRELAGLLGQYEADRETYPDFAAFLPRVVEFFDALPLRIEARLARAEAGRPRLLSASPENGAASVPPELGQIVFRFDRPMKRDGYSVMLGPEGRETFPEVLGASFDPAGRVFTLEVKLEPGRSYAFSLNSEGGGAFQGLDGHPLEMVRYSFTTAAEG